MKTNIFPLTHKDALVIVDVQNDFLPGGHLGVPAGNEIISPLNCYIDIFTHHGLPIFATRDWHPTNHSSFQSQGGLWPAHCIAGSTGAEFASALKLPQNVTIVSKAMVTESDVYSAFEGTTLANQLHARRIERLFIGGLETDHCVLNTMADALSQGFHVVLLQDAVRAANFQQGDGQAAIAEMIRYGAQPLQLAG
jgi:nicotinamidase/pyrazinamidase